MLFFNSEDLEWVESENSNILINQYYNYYHLFKNNVICRQYTFIIEYSFIIEYTEQMKSSSLSEKDEQIISSIFSSQKVLQYLIEQINELYNKYQESYSFSFSTQHNHLLINFRRTGSFKSDTTDGSNSSNCMNYEPYEYILKLTKSFPIYGLRLQILKGHHLQPSLNDSRDLVFEVLGDIWTYKNNLKDIFQKLTIFEEKLACRNQNCLGMQKTGQFQLGDIYSRSELKKFAALQIYEDHTPNKKQIFLGTTQTHLLMFKSNAIDSYFLNMACQLQCIRQIKKHDQCKLDLTIFKYKKIKNFYEYDKVNLSCCLEDSEKFLRNILKNITKFQKIYTGLELADNWRKQNNFQNILIKIKDCEDLQEIMKEDRSEERQARFKKLTKNYQQIVQYFSARGNCYYLIYVNKLNNLFSQNKQLK